MKIGLAAMAGLLLLAGCSSVPDAVNPVEWYRSATGLFGDDEASATQRPTDTQSARSQPGDQAYPNLGTVPARPADISSPSERRAMQQGLVADRDQARYTDQQPANAVGTGTSPVMPPVASPAASQGTPRTAPAAAPTQAAAPTSPAAPATPAPAAQAPAAQAQAAAEAAPSVESTPSAARPPAARIAPRAEPMESRSAGAAMLERRRQEVLAERAAAAAAADDSKQPQAPTATPQASAPQANVAQPSAPSARTEPRPEATTEPRPRTAAEIYREEFDRSASPVATRSAEPTPGVPQTAAVSQDTAAPAVSDRAGISYLAATILFGHGSTTLDPGERETLRKIAADHHKTGGTLRIVGHASSRTTDMRPLQHQLANFQVSVGRAETVAQELIRLGVPTNAMQVVGVGDSQPIYYEVMPAGETGNRRVEIFVDY